MTTKIPLNTDKLNRMKKEYQEINTPKQLEGMVAEAIHRAKTENRRQEKMKKIVKRSTAGVAAAAVLSIALLNVNPGIAYALDGVPVIGSIARALTFQEYTKKDGNMELNMTIPSVEGSDQEKVLGQLNSEMGDYAQSLKERFEQDVADMGGQDGRESMDTTFTVLTDNDKVFSARFETVIAVGSSDSFAKYYNVDKQKGQILTLGDLFQQNSDYVSAVSADIIEQMKQQQAESEDKIYWIGENAAAEEDEFKSIEPDQSFYITPEGQLVIAFDKYEVAPGYMGTCEFMIHHSAIEAIVNENLVTN